MEIKFMLPPVIHSDKSHNYYHTALLDTKTPADDFNDKHRAESERDTFMIYHLMPI